LLRRSRLTISYVFRILSRRIEVKKMSLSIAAAALSIACGTAGFAAELPSYETTGFPISPVQVSVLGAANAREQSPVATSVTPVQLSVLTPRSKVTTARAAPIRTDRSIR
jgi:hypothetical protein